MDVAEFSLDARRYVQLRGGLLIALVLAAWLGSALDLALPWPWLTLIFALMLAAQFSAWRRLRREGERSSLLSRQLAFDLVAMAALFYLTGGATNPLISLLLLPVVVAALTLPLRRAMALAALAITCYSGLMVFSLPLPVEDVARATRLHLSGMWLTFVVSALLVAGFLTRMAAAIRARDAALAAAREQALRDAQVVALGQLAAGAAHELGTPLATLRVLCDELAGDRRLPEECRGDLDLMRRQIEQCKAIIGRMTQRVGMRRAEAMTAIGADDWLAGLLERWRTLWPQANARLVILGEGKMPSVTPPLEIEQAIMSLLDNAARSAPEDIELRLAWNAEALRVSVADRGPGFPAHVLARAGAEPLPGQGQGQGLGLWLARSAVERCGGHLELANTGTGAEVVLEWPQAGLPEKGERRRRG